MDKKFYTALFIGITVAGLVMLIAGLIVHFAVKHSFIAYVISWFAILFGAIMSGLAFIILIIIFITARARNSKDKTDNQGE